MENPSKMESTVEEEKPSLLVIIEFIDAQYYLTQSVMDFDKDPLFSMSILHLLIRDAMGYASDWKNDTYLDNAVFALEQAIPNQEAAFEIARQTTDLINQQLIDNFPDFAESRYSGKYTFEFIGENNGKIGIRYWANGVPGGRTASTDEALF